MRTSNPVLKEKAFLAPAEAVQGEKMTLDGTVNRTGLLLILVVGAASYTWNMVVSSETPRLVMPWIWGGVIAALVLSLVIIFKKTTAPYLSPAYALAEGLCLGGLSAIFEARYPGIVLQAVTLTFGVLFGLLALYRSRLIKATENFKLGIAAATMAVGLFYLVSFGLRALVGYEIPYIHESGPIGIGFSAFVVFLAAMNLVLDFDFIEQGVENGLPKYMEWYAAFGLVLTLVWLYLEILRLLSKLRDR